MASKHLLTLQGKKASYALHRVGGHSSRSLALTVTRQGKTPVIHTDTSLKHLQTFVESGVTLALPTKGVAFAALPPATTLPAPSFPAGATQAEKLAFAAKYYVGNLRSDSDPNTDGGNLGCAWAVNYIVAKTGLAPIGTELTSTHSMYEALNNGRGTKLDQMASGCLIISPTPDPAPPGVNGHVGIIADDMLIYSNHSSTALWSQGPSVRYWMDRYVNQFHLPMEFYAL
jgi:hypothetical protein